MSLIFGIICPTSSLPKSLIDLIDKFDVSYPLCIHHSIQSWDNCSYREAMLCGQWEAIHLVRHYGSIHQPPVNGYSNIITVRASKDNVNCLRQDLRLV